MRGTTRPPMKMTFRSKEVNFEGSVLNTGVQKEV